MGMLTPTPSMSPRTFNKYLLSNTNNVFTIRGKQTLSAGDTRVNTVTFNTVFQCPAGRFDQVRLIYGNIETGGVTFTVKSIVGCPSDPGIGGVSSSKKWTTDSNNSTITNDGATGWQAVTYGGSPTGNTPAMGSDTTQLGLLFSDWMPLTSIPPINGARPFLITRTIVTASTGTTFSNFNHKTDARNFVYDTSVYRETYVSSGDSVSSSPASFSGGSNQSVSPCIGVEFMLGTQIVRFLCVGDSLTQGVDNTGGNTLDWYSWIQYAQDSLLSANPSTPANFINCGYSGATTTQVSAFGKQAIAFHEPDVVVYPPFSPNDGTPTQAIIDTQYRRALAFANYALSQKVLPIFIFIAPNNAYTSVSDAFRLQLKNRCLASGIHTIDLTPSVSDNASPEHYRLGTNSDSTHFNANGYQLAAPYFISFVNLILALRYGGRY